MTVRTKKVLEAVPDIEMIGTNFFALGRSASKHEIYGGGGGGVGGRCMNGRVQHTS